MGSESKGQIWSWLRLSVSHHDFIFREPLDPVGNHRWNFELALCDLFRAFSRMTPLSPSIVGQLKLAGEQGVGLEIDRIFISKFAAAFAAKWIALTSAGAFKEWDVGLIGENDVHAIGAISAVKPNELWAQSVCFENFLHLSVFRSGGYAHGESLFLWR